MAKKNREERLEWFRKQFEWDLQIGRFTGTFAAWLRQTGLGKKL